MAPGLTYLHSLRDALHTLLAEDPRTLVLGEDILDPYGGAFKVTQGLSSRFPDRVLTTVIPRNTDMRDAHFSKQDIFTFSPQSRAAEAYNRLIDELFYEEKT